MAKNRRPIRHVTDELFDVEWPYAKREEVIDAYVEFWATLDIELAETLDMMLL